MLKSIFFLCISYELALSQNWVAIPGFNPNGAATAPTRPRLTQRPTSITSNPTISPTNRPTPRPTAPLPTTTTTAAPIIINTPLATQSTAPPPAATNPATTTRPIVSIPFLPITGGATPSTTQTTSTTTTTTTSTTKTGINIPINPAAPTPQVIKSPTVDPSIVPPPRGVRPPSINTIYKGGVALPGFGHNGGPAPTAPQQSVTSEPVPLPPVSFKPIHIPGLPTAMVPNVPGSKPRSTVPPAPTLPPVDPLIYPSGELYSLYNGGKCGRGPGQFCAGHKVNSVEAFVDNGLQNAMIVIQDPMDSFKLLCTQKSSCEGATIEIRYPYTGTCGQTFVIGDIGCSGVNSCANMDLTINNEGPMGCNKVSISNVACNEIGSCDNAKFNFLGEVETVNCDMGPSGHSARGLDACYTDLSSFVCADVRACSGIRQQITNPTSGFTLECASLDSCKTMDLTIYLDATGWWDPNTGNQIADHVSVLSGFKFAGEGSFANGKITIMNNQQGKSLEIEKVECTALNSCSRAIFNLGENTKIKEFHCFANTCNGCMVKEGWNDFGKPCAEYAPVRR